jgi:hypothetical protein
LETIQNLRELFVGRKVIDVQQRVYPPDDEYSCALPADYPVFFLDDGSEIVLLDGNGSPPLFEREKPPHLGDQSKILTSQQ